MGWPNVDAMLREMTSQQFDEWIAYYQLEPFGIMAEDALIAHWKAIYVNANRRKGKQAMKTEKFLLFRDKEADATALYDTENEDEVNEKWTPETSPQK
jgi:hypothetical protein